MLTRDLQVINELGIHARPAQHIVKIASRYRAELFLVKDGHRINAKSIMGVLMLAAEQGSTVRLEAEGEGAEDLLREIEQLFADRFHED
ncbi:MAG: HPr family phosphocarrier protein [bacterium]|jgi:phosphocarrier protein|nr:HPr family phosphocarrier protein [bacterium]